MKLTRRPVGGRSASRSTQSTPDRLPLPYRAAHGRDSTEGVAPPAQQTHIRLPYDDSGEALHLETAVWRPSEVSDYHASRTAGLARTRAITPES